MVPDFGRFFCVQKTIGPPREEPGSLLSILLVVKNRDPELWFIIIPIKPGRKFHPQYQTTNQPTRVLNSAHWSHAASHDPTENATL